MDIEYWMIRAKISSKQQAKFFGTFGAWRPYIFAAVDTTALVDDKLIIEIIANSFHNVPVYNVSYKRYFNLEENETFEFQFARVTFDGYAKKQRYGKFRTLTL